MAENHKFLGVIHCPRCGCTDVVFDEDEHLLKVVNVSQPDPQSVDDASPYSCNRCRQAFYLGYDQSLGVAGTHDEDSEVTIVRSKPYKDGTSIVRHLPEGPIFE